MKYTDADADTDTGSDRKKHGNSREAGKIVEKKKAQAPAKRLPGRAEQTLTPVERRQKELEKKLNPTYNREYIPYSDPAEVDEDIIKNTHYEKVSERYRFAKWAVMLLLVCYALIMVFVFEGQITLENFRYLLRNVDFDIETGIELENDIIYNADSSDIFVKYRDYLAVVGKTKLSIYDNKGKTAYTEKLSLKSPAVCTSSKYMLVYDREGVSYSLYTYFTRAKTDSCDYPVSDAAVSDTGVYALATRSADYTGAVYIYNGSFKLINRVLKNKYISSIDIKGDGSEVLIAAYETDALGRLSTEITVLPTATNEVKLTFTLENSLALSCRYTEDGGFAVVCGDAVRFYDSDGKLRGSYSAPDGERCTEGLKADSGGVTVILSGKDDKSRFYCLRLDSTGKLLFDREIDGSPTAFTADSGFVYILYGDRLLRLSEDGNSEFCFNGVTPVDVVSRSGGVYICTRTVAIVPVWDERE